tara:strand:+ start:133 stop:1395 length:1263 start_codon:yes stop_codon:yes gene_type:complete
MSKIKFNINILPSLLVFILFYLSLILGFSLDEDSAGGAKYDYHIHLKTLLFFDNISAGLLNYDKLENLNNTHSPIFIIFLKFVFKFFGDFSRFFYLNLCLASIWVFFLILREKYEKLSISNSFLISNFFLLSPYFRSSSIWPGDENIAILFFLLSVFFYIRYSKNNHDEKKFLNLFCNILFLAIASYFRPIYSLFSVFFFYEMILKNFQIKYFLYYVSLSLLLSFPAIYYIFFLKINFFDSYISSKNILNSSALAFTVFFFYLIPLFLFTKKKFTLNKYLAIISLILSVVIYCFFDYENTTGGGIIFRVLKYYLINENIFLFIFSLTFLFSFYFCFNLLKLNQLTNIILVTILVFFEIDSNFYQESYDPLFLICIFFLFSNTQIKNIINKEGLRVILTIFLWLFLFLIIKIYSNYLFTIL